MIYAGIGSRQTPWEIRQVMVSFAQVVAPYATLRSGGAEGADLAFEFGATIGGGKREIYLPWKGFNGCLNGTLNEPTDKAFELAKQYHSGFAFLSHGGKKLIARDGHQVLGEDLDTPADMIVCWTPDGSHNGQSKKSGGTGQALRIAAAYEIPVYNLQREGDLQEINALIDLAYVLSCSYA